MEKRIDIWITFQGGVAQNVLHAISMAALTSSDFDFAEEDGRLIYSESGVEKVSNVIREDIERGRLLVRGSESYSWDGFAATIPQYNQFLRQKLLPFVKNAVNNLSGVACHTTKSSWRSRSVLDDKSAVSLELFDRLYHNRGDDVAWANFVRTSLPSSRMKRLPPAPYTLFRILTEEYGWREDLATELMEKYAFGLLLYRQGFAEPIK